MRANASQKTFLSKRKLYQQPFFQKESLTKETRLFLLRKNCVQVFGEVLLHQRDLFLD
jgi:hypothetical protein